jgi:hypothetical protein
VLFFEPTHGHIFFIAAKPRSIFVPAGSEPVWRLGV